ncbi:MAG: DUF2752 domain-containing protein [Alloprevotella sp.]|nr:DUF2752 domain-containing protein [Alloprevotella sp.]
MMFYRKPAFWFMCLAIGLMAWLAMTALFDPTANAWAPKCLLHAATGLQCPSCGFQRAAHALLHGRFVEAWNYNWFLFLVLPYVAALVVGECLPGGPWRERIRAFTHHRYVLYAYLTLYFLWGILRNIWGI